ncbi:type I-E CRISPR-associated protein Cse2/CasB [Bifidobacterium aerophilum]|uniref:Type I-E CRISPR-associated protein Cse2/CasB n=1 Tax=Bifidobacterium aerophilum TaxID=1798155 RepID=A0A6N9Z6K7_9BIFI|nr:type I-E CRISPR-associated protein Cse2/CasB [Bifidobacterium aerophilum]NEG89755.1 type I-E CRISPR-associated protein Cse2/CasB [Bifidobacterium aerophilum]
MTEQDKKARDFPVPRLTAFGMWVSGQARRLATGGRDEADILRAGYLRNDPYSTAAVARLRHAAGHEVGVDPDVLVWTIPDPLKPDVCGTDANQYADGPSPRERAAHAALTLFATHQQSIHDKSMHTDADVSMGRAVGRMACDNFNEAGIRRMFGQLQTASSWKELVRHARGLTGLLRRERIALNYGLLAQDLLALRSDRERANAVRTRWGRDFQSGYRRKMTDDSAGESSETV